MTAKVSNNAFGLLAAAINNTVTTLSVGAGEGARFPSLGVGDYFYATLIDTGNNLEIIKVTARSIDSMTIVRAQDGTTAKAYALNDRVELRPVAALFNEKVDLETVTSVARGGTGLATLTANNVVLGNGTSAVQFVAAGTSGNVLTSTGTTWASAAGVASNGELKSMQVFTASGTYTKPVGLVRAKITVVGGGGGSGSSPSSGTVSGGGGGGGAAIRLVETGSIGATETVTRGAGGGSAAAGGTSSFGTLASASGGAAGASLGGAGGAGSGGSINSTGGSGDAGTSGGAGGGTILGGRTRGSSASNGGTGVLYGGGGTGGTGGPGTSGGAGAAGIVIVEEFF